MRLKRISFVFMVFVLACSESISEPSTPKAPEVWQDLINTTFISCSPSFYKKEDNVCTDTLEGYVADTPPFDKYGMDMDSTSIHHLHVIDKRLFAANEEGYLWSKIHGDTTWELLNQNREFMVVLPRPFFRYQNKNYLLTYSGDVYEIDRNGVKEKSPMNLPKDWCRKDRQCFFSQMNTYKNDLYLFNRMGRRDGDSYAEFLYKSTNAGLSWKIVENFQQDKHWIMSDWAEYDGYAYFIVRGENIYQFDGETFIEIWWDDPKTYTKKVENYGSLEVLNGNLYASASSTMLQIKDTSFSKVFDGFTTHTILDTLCGSLVNASPMDYYNPKSMAVQPIAWADHLTNGYELFFASEVGFAYESSLLLNLTYSPKRIGDTLYLGTNSRRRDGEIPEPGSVVTVNLRNVNICPDAWERGEKIGGRTRWGGVEVEK